MRKDESLLGWFSHMRKRKIINAPIRKTELIQIEGENMLWKPKLILVKIVKINILIEEIIKNMNSKRIK